GLNGVAGPHAREVPFHDFVAAHGAILCKRDAEALTATQTDSVVSTAQLLALLALLATTSLARLAPALADQARLDADAAHQAEAVHPQERPLRIRFHRRALHVLEAAHDRRAADVDRQPRRPDDLDPAHQRIDRQLGHPR